MIIYLLKPDVNHFQVLISKNDADYKVLIEIHGQSLKEDWKPFELKPYKGDNFNKKLPKGDFPYLSGGILILSQKSVNCLKDLILPYGEFLPVNCDDDDYTLFNVTNVIDALDLEKSDILYFDDGTNDVEDILSYTFIKEKVENQIIFRIKQMPQVDIFVTDKFVELVEKSGLKGFEFRKVWEG